MSKAKSIFILLVTLLTIAVLLWVYSVMVVDRSEQKKIKKERVEAENNLNRLKNERANYITIKQTRDIQIANFDTLKLHIPAKENSYGNNTYIKTLDTIREIAAENNVEIDLFKPLLVNTFPDIQVEANTLEKRVERYIVELECHGDYLSLGNFFQDLQDHDKIINLLKFNIETEFGNVGGLYCEATLYTYVFSENN